MGNCWVNDRGMWVDWERVDLYGKMGVSKIVREIEGIVGNEWGWVMGKLGERVGLSDVKGLVNWGVFGKWMGMGGKFKRGGWWLGIWLNDDWFVESLLHSCSVNSGYLLEIYPSTDMAYKYSYTVLYRNS